MRNIGTAPPSLGVARQVLGAAIDPPTGAGTPASQAFRETRQRLLLGFIGYYLCAVFLCWLISRNVDDRVVVTILGHSFVFEQLRVRVLEAAILTALVTPAVFALELVAVGWERSSLHSLLRGRSASGRSDFVCFALWHVHLLDIPKVGLTFGVALVTGGWLHDWLRERAGISLSLGGMPLLIQYTGYFLLVTFWDYWQHRLEHSRYFWPIHRYHHSADEFHILTSMRVHPATFSRVIAMTLPLAVVNAPPSLIAGTAFGATILRFIIHSRIDSDFGWIGRWLLQSPIGHRFHHRLNPAGLASNLSLFPVWDRLFGTWQDGGSQRVAIGVAEPYRQGAWILPDMWRDYREFLVQLAALLRWRKAPVRES